MRTEAEVEKLVRENEGLVGYWWKFYKKWSTQVEDLKQAGRLGLVQAAQHWDPARGEFGACAALWIRQAMRATLSRESLVHVPDKKQYTHRLWPKNFTPISPTDAIEDADHPVLSGEYKIGRLNKAAGHEVELFQAEAHLERKRLVAELVGCLTAREQRVIRRRFGLDRGEGRKLREVAREMNLTRQRVQQIESVAIRKMRVRGCA